MFCGNVNFDIDSVIGFVVTFAALKAFLIKMNSICVISYCLRTVSLEFTDLASNYFWPFIVIPCCACRN